jgi:hypothetical protein
MIRKALTIFFGIFSCNFKPTVVQTSITSVKIARNKNKTKAAGKSGPSPKGEMDLDLRKQQRPYD